MRPMAVHLTGLCDEKEHESRQDDKEEQEDKRFVCLGGCLNA